MCHHIVAVGAFWQVELAFTVSHPDAEFRTSEVAEHHRIVFRNRQADEVGFKLVAIVVVHVRLAAVFRVEQVEFNHHLATVADTEAQSVGALVEVFECLFSLFVPHEAAYPSLSRAKHVAVGETAAEHNHIHIFKCFATAHQVGHVHVFHIESCKVE